MYAVHIYTEVECDEPTRGRSVEEAIAGYDLTDREVENVFELAGGDIAIAEKEPEGYRFQSVRGTANYLNIALRVMDAFGDGMKDSSRVFDAARIALTLKRAGFYVFPFCNPFIDMLISAMRDGETGLTVEDVLEWIVKFAGNEEHTDISNPYTVYIERFGESGQKGLREFAAQIISCVHRNGNTQPNEGREP